MVLFAGSMALGAGILVLRGVVYGAADPFDDGWPVFLQATAFGTAFVVAKFWRRHIAIPIGLYVGLVAYMLMAGNPEYHAASVIALAVYGLLPSLAGWGLANALRYGSGASPLGRDHG